MHALYSVGLMKASGVGGGFKEEGYLTCVTTDESQFPKLEFTPLSLLWMKTNMNPNDQ